jgi:acetyl esterase/lipase
MRLMMTVAATAAAVVLAGCGAADLHARTVRYGSNPLQAIDAYRAPKPGAPLVVLVHGGGWVGNKRQLLTGDAAALSRAGFAVFNMDYRLDSPTQRAFPMEVADVEAATRWAIAHATAFNASPAKVVLVGGSSGGQLVALAAENMHQVRSVVTLSGAFDFPSLLRDAHEEELPFKLGENVDQALGCSDECWAAVAYSPSRHLRSCRANWLMFNSSEEVMPLDQLEAMRSALKRRGCRFQAHVLSGTKHAFAYWAHVSPTLAAFIETG